MEITELMEKAVPEIEKLARHYNVPEPKAVEAYGHLLNLSGVTEDILTFNDCQTHIRALLLKQVRLLTHEEARVGLCLNLLRVKQKPFLSDPMTRTGRNEPCPCGSGKKFKLCCLSNARKHEYERYISSTTFSN